MWEELLWSPRLLVVVSWGPGEWYSLFSLRCWVYKCHILHMYVLGWEALCLSRPVPRGMQLLG